LVLGKVLSEEMRDAVNKTDSAFLAYKDKVANEGVVKWRRQNAVSELNKTDWYVSPFNTSRRSLNAEQDYDVKQCIFNSFFSNVLANTRYLLIKKAKSYFGYESMASCWEPSENLTIFTTISPNLT